MKRKNLPWKTQNKITTTTKRTTGTTPQIVKHSAWSHTVANSKIKIQQ